jgi:hypothetical protein
MHEHMPIGGDEWDLVLEQHSIPYPGREVDSLRRKFAQLHRVKTPTGDPRCPQEVKLAKCIKYIISSCADIGDGMEEMDLVTGTFTNTTPTEDDQEVRIAELLGSDNDSVDAGEDGELEDEVPGEFEAPSIPNDDMNLLLAQHTA